MKKNYCRPESKAINLTTSTLLAQSMKYTNEAADKNTEVLAGKQRGEWGDIWK